MTTIEATTTRPRRKAIDVFSPEARKSDPDLDRNTDFIAPDEIIIDGETYKHAYDKRQSEWEFCGPWAHVYYCDNIEVMALTDEAGEVIELTPARTQRLWDELQDWLAVNGWRIK